jgi:ubiquinone/menaquinone biosynthesis C-methylase UbiE
MSSALCRVYERRILPHLLHATMRMEAFSDYRRRLVSGAEGRVLEIGVGSGLNLPYYSARVERVIGLDPSAGLLSIAARSRAGLAFPLALVQGSAEAIPLVTGGIDTVVAAWTFCSVPDVPVALAEVRRVLTPGGRLLFVEHGRSPDPRVARWQDRLTPLWRKVAGGCHLNRHIGQLLEQAGLQIERMETGRMTGPRVATFMYEGRARVPAVNGPRRGTG